MKKKLLSVLFASFLSISISSSLHAQAFHKGSLLVSLSEGSTKAFYSTSDVSTNKPVMVHKSYLEGDRDPLVIEYGISNHWGLGFTSGNDIFHVNPSEFYGFELANNKAVKASTSEFTFDGNYHFFVTQRLDLSAFTSLGMYSVSFKGKEISDGTPYVYKAAGNMIRGGVKVRYYFYKRFGAFGMMSSYFGNTSPKEVKGNTVAKNYSTKITGNAIEIGLCYRFIK